MLVLGDLNTDRNLKHTSQENGGWSATVSAVMFDNVTTGSPICDSQGINDLSVIDSNFGDSIWSRYIHDENATRKINTV